MCVCVCVCVDLTEADIDAMLIDDVEYAIALSLLFGENYSSK